MASEYSQRMTTMRKRAARKSAPAATALRVDPKWLSDLVILTLRVEGGKASEEEVITVAKSLRLILAKMAGARGEA